MPTEVIETIKPAGGGDFTTLQSWESSLPANLVTNDEVRIAEVFSGGNASDGSTTITIQGQTTDLTRYIEVRAAAGHEHKGTGRVINKNKAYVEIDADTAAVDVRSNYVRFVDMQFTATSAMNQNRQVVTTLTDLSTAQNRFTRCVFNKEAGGSVVLFRGGGQSGSRDNINVACVFIGDGGGSVAICAHNRVNVSNQGRTRYHNCTIIARGGTTFAFSEGGLGHRIRSNNCYMRASTIYQGIQDRYAKIGGDATNNSEASHPSHRSIFYTDDNFTDTTFGSEDLHIVASGVLANTGDNRVNGPFTLDRDEYVVLIDWEGEIFAAASGTFPIPGSGYFIGADAVVPTAGAGPAELGGYIRSTADGPASGFLGGYIEGGPFVGPTGFLGGYVLAKAVTGNNLVGLLGGYTKTDGGIKPPSFLGGFVFSIPVVDDGPEFLGGFASGLTQAEATLGGCTIGRPDKTQFAAARSRNLVVATSDDVVKQGLEFDAQIIFKGIFDRSFNAKVDNEKTWQNEINAKVDVQKFRIPPSVFIQSITAVVPSGELASNPSGQPVPTFDPNGARKYCVVASGTLGDGESWIGARIDFADPFGKNGGFKPLFSVSGIAGPPPWNTCHDFDISGLYVISVTAQDNDGMVGSAVSGLNLASGAGFGTHFPAISISGDPRMGFVPPSLQVDFTTISSGVSVPPFTAAESAASQPSSPTDERIYWNLGNRETSRRKNPTTFYSSPGLYAPKVMFHYTSPSGGQFMISDTLLVGFNN